MRLRTLATLTALLAAFAAPVTAHAAVSDPFGSGCQFTGTEDPTAETGTVTGVLSGGPLILVNDDNSGVGSGTLTCRLQVNEPTHTGTGPAVSGHGTGVVSAGPSEASFTASETDNVYLCMEFTDDSTGVTYYWDDSTGTWTTDPDGPCGLAGIVFGVVHCLVPPYWCGVTRLVDPAICATLAGLSPGVPPVYIDWDGDVWINGVKWFDCPPYFP